MQLISSDIICKDEKGRTGKFSTAPSELSHLVHVIIFFCFCVVAPDNGVIIKFL